MKLKRIIKLVGAGYTIYSLVKSDKRKHSTSNFKSKKTSKFSKAAKYYSIAKAISKIIR